MTLEILKGGMLLGALLAFIALGYALVFGILKFINFAHGDLITLGAYLAYTFTRILGLGVVASSIISVALTGIAGVLIERLAFRPLRGHRLSMFLSSFGVSMMLNATITILFSSTSRTIVDRQLVDVAPPSPLREGAAIPILVALTVLGSLLVFRRTNYGLAIRAISEDAVGVAVLGIPLDRLVSVVFFASSALAGLAGIFLGLRYGLTPQMGFEYGIWAFAIVVIAGFGSIIGIVAAGLISGIAISATLAILGAHSYVNVVLFAIMTIILLFRPRGLFGTELRRI